MAPVETKGKLTDPEMVDELKLQTERWKMWKFLQAVVELQRFRIRRHEAVAQMAYWSGLDPSVCDAMLDGLMLEKRSVYLKSKPKLTLLRFD